MSNSQLGLTLSRMRCIESIGSERDCVTVLLCQLRLCIIIGCLSRLEDPTAANESDQSRTRFKQNKHVAVMSKIFLLSQEYI